MAFINDVTIYESKLVQIKINQCHNPGKKTNVYAIRRDDTTGLADLLGLIKWSGRWRQYVFEPEKDTMWSSGCMKGIVEFLEKINKKHRAVWKKNGSK